MANEYREHGVGAWDWDILNDRVVVNQRFASLYGVHPVLARAGLPIAEFYKAMHPDDRDSVVSAIKSAVETGAHFSEEYRLIQRDGAVRWVIAEGECSYDVNGAAIRFPGYVFDITARKRIEQILQETNTDVEVQVLERMQVRGALWSSIPDFLCALTPDGIFKTSNPAWRTRLGWSETELAAVRFFDFVHADDRTKVQDAFRGATRTVPDLGFECRYRCKDQSYRDVLWAGVLEDGILYCSGRSVSAKAVAAINEKLLDAAHQSAEIPHGAQSIESLSPETLLALLGSLETATDNIRRVLASDRAK